jgi:hypothetical protein
MNFFTDPIIGKRITTWVVLVLILLVLVSLLFPFALNSHHGGRQVVCASHIGQLIGACEAYAASESDTLPFPWATGADKAKGHVQDAHQARLITVRAMALLVLECNISNDILTCPNSPFPGPHTKPSRDAHDDVSWGASRDSNVGYALDWAVSRDAGSDRVVLTDRDPVNHHGKIYLGYADSHTISVHVETTGVLTARPLTSMRTEGSDGAPVPMTTLKAADDVYAPAAGDVKAQLTQDGGDREHAWVK